MDTTDSSSNARTSHGRPHENDTARLGELLRRAREGRGLTLEQISQETKIPRRHLEEIEHDNLTVVPGGFYRRNEVRVYARAVNLDLSLALAQLERVLDRPAALEAFPETPTTHQPTASLKRALIVVGVAVAAAVFWRAMGAREPALDPHAQERSAASSPQNSVPPVRETPPAVGTSQRTQSNPAGEGSATSVLVLAEATEATGAGTPAASSVGLAKKTELAKAPASADLFTELVVTTQPAGARVMVNEIGWGRAPVTIRYLTPGTKRIRVAKEGYVTEERVVRLAEGHSMMLDIPLRSAP